MIEQEEILETGSLLSLAERRAFMKLPAEQRRRLLAAQAERMAERYETNEESEEREHWQGGDIVEY